MVQFSFYIFLIHLSCIVYLMNSGEGFIIQFAKSARMTHLLLKIQFFIMAMCYVGLMYSCIANAEFYETIISYAKRNLGQLEYIMAIWLYIIIHLLWCTHFVDLSIKAHIYKHSKSGVYSTRFTRFLSSFIHLIYKKSKHNGN